jgi:hypothetical protein
MVGKLRSLTRSKVPCEGTLRCTIHQGSASSIQDVPHNTVTASYLAVESSFAPSPPQVVLLEILSRFHSTYDVETMGKQLATLTCSRKPSTSQVYPHYQ